MLDKIRIEKYETIIKKENPEHSLLREDEIKTLESIASDKQILEQYANNLIQGLEECPSLKKEFAKINSILKRMDRDNRDNAKISFKLIKDKNGCFSKKGISSLMTSSPSRKYANFIISIQKNYMVDKYNSFLKYACLIRAEVNSNDTVLSYMKHYYNYISPKNYRVISFPREHSGPLDIKELENARYFFFINQSGIKDIDDEYVKKFILLNLLDIIKSSGFTY